MKKSRVICAAAILSLLLSGCTGLSLNSPDILSPPKAQGDQAQIQELIRKSADGKYEMVYPESGSYNSSVIFRDLDNDGVEEAVAMYTPDSENIRIMIAERHDDSYAKKAECTVYAPKLNAVEFTDFEGDGTTDILLAYPGAAPSLQSLTILSSGDNIVQNDFINACAAHLIGDYDGDKKDDLLTLALADGETLPTAKLLGDVNGTLAEKSACEIASDVKEYVSLSFGKISDSLSGAIIDAKDDNGEYATQLICCDADTGDIINPLYVNNSYRSTKRIPAIFSADVDNDGVVEIPVCSVMDYSQNEESSAVCERIDWSCYDYTQLDLRSKCSAVLCDKLGFLLNLTPEHSDIITARYTGENSMAIYLWEYKRSTPERTTKLLTVKRYPKSDYDENSILEAVAGQDSEYVYTYIIETESEYYSYTDDEVTGNFVIIGNQPQS